MKNLLTVEEEKLERVVRLGAIVWFAFEQRKPGVVIPEVEDGGEEGEPGPLGWPAGCRPRSAHVGLGCRCIPCGSC